MDVQNDEKNVASSRDLPYDDQLVNQSFAEKILFVLSIEAVPKE